MLNLERLLELYLNRKDSFKKAEERMKRREEFFEQIKKIDQMNDVTEDQKRALKNSASQALAGKASVNFELMDYYHKKPEFVNFEIIAPLVFIWLDLIDKNYIGTNLRDLRLKKVKYYKELLILTSQNILFTLIFIVLIKYASNCITFISSAFLIGNTISSIGYLCFLGLWLALLLFFIYLWFSLLDLPRLLK
ncbi:hypothetical protein [Acinetobacter sp. Marseille-Q1623]|uniref:hypothetical protein n=1 Tax=Acinetobacter sp. Marseille-Q1623 TaxID=2697501 RepID=UPI00157B4022|nr:hypothetical protein [Acinetobacter sp. Marseille-Q1623]